MSNPDDTQYRFPEMSEERMREFMALASATQGPLAQFDGAPPPVDDSTAMSKARTLVDDGRWASAVALLDTLVATPAHAQDTQALSLRAEARLGGGDAAGAVVDWLAVLALDPRFARAYRGLADAYGLLGDAPRADYFRHLGTSLTP